jgi:DNA replication initiation complex subunit (GINS family)
MYNDILEALKNELESSSLSRLPKDFYINVKLYIKGLKDKIEFSSGHSADILRGELDLAIKMISLLFKLRVYKIVRGIFMGLTTPPEGILDEELDAYMKIREAIHTSLNSFTSSINSMEDNTKRILVRFTASVPAFVGVDLVVYGPFEPEDVANIPLINSEVLIMKGVAEKLEV